MNEQHPGARPVRPRNRAGSVYVPNETLTAQLAAERALADDLAAALQHIGMTTWGLWPWPNEVENVLARYREARRP